MPRCLLFSILLLSICLTRTNAQICSNNYYQTSLHYVGDTYSSSLTLLPGGNAIISQYVNENFNLIKITSSGDTLWNKIYLTSNTYDRSYSHATKLDNDGTLLCLIKIDELLKVDTNGVVLSARHIQLPDYRYAYDIQVLANGDKILLFNSLGAVDGGTIIRLGNDLQTIKWSKDVNGNFGHFTNALIDNDQIIIAASNSMCRFDLATGALLGFTNYTMGSLPSRIKKIYKCGDGYLATVTLYDNQNGYYGYARFSSSLSLLSVRQLQRYDDYTITEYAFSCAPQPDGSFYMAYGGFADVSLSYINKKDEVQWSERFPLINSYPDDMQQSDDALYIVGSDNYFNVAINTNEAQTDIIKCGRNGFYAGCNPAVTKELVFTSYPFTQGTASMVVDDIQVAVSSFAVLVSTYVCDILTKCYKTITCDTLKILGNTSVCSAAAILLTGSKNANCSVPVQWSSSPQQGCTLSPNNDSTVSAEFSESGIYTIYGAINTLCGATIIDSLKITVNLLSKLDLGSDTFICSNPIALHAGKQFKTYVWQDGSTDSIYQVKQAGKYFVTTTDGCQNQLSDTILVNDVNPSFTAGRDTVKCSNDTITLTATDGFINYKWSPQYNISTSAGRVIKAFPFVDTNYIVTAEKYTGCFVSDTVAVGIISSPTVFLGTDTSLCEGSTVLLNVVTDNSTYNWQNNTTGSSYLVSRAGIYWVDVTKNKCTSRDSIKIAYDALPFFSFGKDNILCDGTSLELKPLSVKGTYSYRWQDGTDASTYPVTQPGIYKLTATNKCGGFSDSVTIVSVLCKLALPSAFTPNNDGVNDLFKIKYPLPVKTFVITIYNRWGQKVFETSDTTKGWNGKTNDADQDTGTYMWTVRVTDSAGVKHSEHGTVTLIR